MVSHDHHVIKMATAVGGDDLAEDWWEARTGLSCRKRNGDSERSSTDPNRMDLEVVKVSASKRKRKKTVDSVVVGVRGGDEQEPLLSPTQQCEALRMALGLHFDGKLTPLEVDHIELQEDWFVQASSSSQVTLFDLLFTVCPDWERSMQKLTQRGSPLALVVGGAALRILDLSRQVAPAVGKGKLAKLFAKHFKVSEQESFLKSTVIPVAMGTPNRLRKLLDNGALGVSKLRLIILDWNWKDQKQRTIAGIPEVWGDLAELLRHSLLPLLRRGKTKIVLY